MRADERSDYLREAPQVHVAVADAVMRADGPSDSAVIATLLDLSQHGLLELRASTRRVTSIFGAVDRETSEFVVDVSRWEEFDPLDQTLVSLLFTTMKRSATMSLEDLKVLLRSRHLTYDAGIAAWRAQVIARAVTDGYLIEGGRRRTAVGEELRSSCDAFKSYIADFGRLEDDELAGLSVWGPYLVWGALFGLADRVLRTMNLEAAGERDDLALAVQTLLK
jgi:hypothetical protein